VKAFLMYPDRDFDLQGKPPWNEPALIQDLELTTLLNAMALGDDFLLEVARKAVLSSLTDVRTILYRQDILKDCLNNSSSIVLQRNRWKIEGNFTSVSSADTRTPYYMDHWMPCRYSLLCLKSCGLSQMNRPATLSQMALLRFLP